MKENYIINENRKPLLDIENDLIEMSKNVKIINSLKTDIDEIVDKKPNKNDFSKNEILNIEDKYKQIKKQINKFMNEKNYIYNFIRIEKSSKNKVNENDENENLLEENKMDTAMENIKKMQDEIKNKVNALDEKLKKVELFEFKKNDSLINEINKNEINDTTIFSKENKQIQKYKNSILNIKADIYNEETKELEKVSKTIEMIKQVTNDMKIYVESQGNKINYLNDEHKKIQDNIENGIDELYETRIRREKKKTNIIVSIICLIFLIIIIIYMIYKKIHSK
jgi:t-SNARE complex subunit (syntaxin)